MELGITIMGLIHRIIRPELSSDSHLLLKNLEEPKLKKNYLQGKQDDGNPEFWNNALTPDFIFTKVNED